ncbi:MAG TPA: OmpH family outer membrane protein [Chitinophagales bacterium]|nr:OmpH family outer membrane protein [Chitinophagales bacterium]
MKSSLLIAWNVVLTVITAALLFIQFGKSAPSATETITAQPATAGEAVATDTRIATINIDSMQNNYTLFVNKKKELEQKQKQMESTLERKGKELQADYAAAQQQAATMTQQQLGETEQRLQKKQADIQQLQSQLTGDLQNQLEQFNKELKDSLDSFLKDYNASNKYTVILSIVEGGQVLYAEPQYDITGDAITGMNARLVK